MATNEFGEPCQSASLNLQMTLHLEALKLKRQDDTHEAGCSLWLARGIVNFRTTTDNMRSLYRKYWYVNRWMTTNVTRSWCMRRPGLALQCTFAMKSDLICASIDLDSNYQIILESSHGSCSARVAGGTASADVSCSGVMHGHCVRINNACRCASSVLHGCVSTSSMAARASLPRGGTNEFLTARLQRCCIVLVCLLSQSVRVSPSAGHSGTSTL